MFEKCLENVQKLNNWRKIYDLKSFMGFNVYKDKKKVMKYMSTA